MRACAFALPLLAGACGTGEEVPFSDTPTADGRYVLHVGVAESRMPQGPRHVRVYLRERGAADAPPLLDTTLANDGVPFTRANIAVRWIASRTALLCLRASDRPDRGWRIEVSPTPRATAVAQC